MNFFLALIVTLAVKFLVGVQDKKGINKDIAARYKQFPNLDDRKTSGLEA